MALLDPFIDRLFARGGRLVRGTPVQPIFDEIVKRHTNRQYDRREARANRGITRISELNGRPDPLLSIDWEASILDGGSTAIPNIYIEELQLPLLRVDNKPVYRDGMMVNYASAVSVDNCTVKLYNDRSGAALNLAAHWVNSVFDFGEKVYNPPSVYKKTILVEVKDCAQIAVYQFRLNGCFPTSLNQTQLTSGSAELIPITLDLSVDSVDILKM